MFFAPKQPFAARFDLMRALLTGLMLAALAGTTPVLAATSPHLRIAQSELGRTQYVEIGVNKSIIIDLPVEANQASPTR